mgnify:CR=1 FL=1
MEVNKVLAEERFREILKLVEEHKTITVQELTELLDTSESTIRRDLTTLHKKGKLIKSYNELDYMIMKNLNMLVE